MDFGIRGRVAIVTGADSGIARETAKLLAAEGARLVLTDLKNGSLEEAAQDIGGEHVTHAGDIAKDRTAKALVELATETWGRLDIVVHAAGVTGAKGDPLEMKDSDWTEAWETDFFSAVRLARGAIPEMRKAGWGRFVAITSENAIQPYWEEAVYNCAKASLACFVKGLSREEAKHGVLVNTVAPAFIETPMTDGMMEKRAKERGESFDEAIRSFLEEERPGIALKRRGKAAEVAAVIAFLCSAQASYVNGANWRVDGGAVMTVEG